MDKTESWDEEQRGEKQALVEKPKRTIWKYPVPILEEFYVTLPRDAKVLRFDNEAGHLWLWADVCPDNPPEERKFYAFKTGAEMGENRSLEYLGMAPIYIQQELMLYYYQVPKTYSGGF